MIKIYKESLESMKQIVADYTQQVTDRVIEDRVADIIATVRKDGDAALYRYAEMFDKVKPDSLEIPMNVAKKAYDELDDELKAALQMAKDNIESFHKLELSEGFTDVSQPGVIRGQMVRPLAKVGLYVPGGTAAYPSTILMSAVPAKLAGVGEIIMVTPPQTAGVNPVVLAAAYLAGVDRIMQVGGAQAVAALAYGTESVPQVDKIIGPGNIYVATAKKQVFGRVSIDMVAGPSEIGILADDTANPKVLAADLLSQAEHDPRARAMLVTDSETLAEAVAQEVENQLAVLPREQIARESIETRSFIAVMDSIEDMFKLMNDIAPEHLEVQLQEPMLYLNLIENAGSVFLGAYASESLGDYIAGPNHVLPTGGTARFSSPLGVYDFVKRTSYLQYSATALRRVGPAVTALARTEGLEGHARSVEARFETAGEASGNATGNGTTNNEGNRYFNGH